MEIQTQLPERHSRKRKKKLLNSIREQIEFYFSDANLRHDKFMRQLIGAEDPEAMGRQSVDLNEFLKFNKISQMTQNIRDISLAIESSKCLRLDQKQLSVKRVEPFVNNDINCDDLTLYVERLPPSADHQWIRSVFEPFGGIQYIKVPHFRHNHNIMGFAFVEFVSTDSVNKAIKHFNRLSSDDTNSEQKVDTNSDTNQMSSETQSHTKTRTEGSLKRCLKTDEEVIDSKKPKLNEEKQRNESEVKDEKCPTNPETIETIKKKKKRKRKRKLLVTDSNEDNEKDVINNLRVMSKKEWKNWRNKYLKLQKQTMSSIKRSLLITTEDSIKPIVCQPNRVDDSLEDRSFESGLIIKLNFKVSSNDFIESEFKRKIRLLADKHVIQYIDLDNSQIEFKDNQTINGFCYIRTKSGEECQQLMANERLRQLGDICVLEGIEETNYWHKIFDQRVEKKSNKQVKSKTKVRGFERIINKAENCGQMTDNKRIKF